MPPKREKPKKKIVKVKPKVSDVKAVAKNVNIINIGTLKGKNKKKTSSTPKKASVVQNIPIRTSPTIYNPAPTPFQIQSQSQPVPISAYTEIMQELKRLDKTNIANSIQKKDIVPLQETVLPTGSSKVNSMFNDVDQTPIPMKRTRLTPGPTTRPIITPITTSDYGKLTEDEKALRKQSILQNLGIGRTKLIN